MKRKVLFGLAMMLGLGASAQTDITLKLNHYWNGDAFSYGTYYQDVQNRVVEITRVQYYLTGFDLVHDGGTNSSLGDTVILASANITNYNLCSANVNSLEAIDFDLGVDAARNHLDPNMYAPSHPLALQNPSMHWGWSAGYRFLVIEGKVDNNDDGIPEKGFQFHVTGDDNYLRNVTQISTTGDMNGSVMEINVDVNIADWVADIDLATAGYNHGVYLLNGKVMDNTNDFTVFTADIGLGIDKEAQHESNVFFDYSMPYAPTIFYKFPNAENVELTITDLNGRIILTESNLQKAGNYFIQKELATGTYLAVFKTNVEAVRTEKFVVQK